MGPRNRRSILKLGGTALGGGLAGCLGDGESTTGDTPTDSPAPPGTTSPADCREGSTDYSWETNGSWQVHVAVRNDDERPYTVTVAVTHHGSEPCHHVESTPCQSPERSETPLERTFDLGAGESKTVTGSTLELWAEWIDDYTVQVRIEGEDTSARDRVFAYERGAREVVGADTYEEADFYVCRGAEREITATVADGTPHATVYA